MKDETPVAEQKFATGQAWNMKQKQSIIPPAPLTQRGEVKPLIPPKPQADIDKKLEELKKRAGKKI